MARLPWSSVNPIPILNIKTIIVIFCRQLLELLFYLLILVLLFTFCKITLYFYDERKNK